MSDKDSKEDYIPLKNRKRNTDTCPAHDNMDLLLEKLDNVVTSLVKVSNDMKWMKVIGYFLIGLVVTIGVPGVWNVYSRISSIETKISNYELTNKFSAADYAKSLQTIITIGKTNNTRLDDLEDQIHALQTYINEHSKLDELRDQELRLKVESRKISP